MQPNGQFGYNAHTSGATPKGAFRFRHRKIAFRKETGSGQSFFIFGLDYFYKIIPHYSITQALKSTKAAHSNPKHTYRVHIFGHKSGAAIKGLAAGGSKDLTATDRRTSQQAAQWAAAVRFNVGGLQGQSAGGSLNQS